MKTTAPEMRPMQTRPRPLISLVIPVLNEEQNIERLYATVRETLAPVCERYDWEFVFTDNHSSDRSFEILKGLAAQDQRIRVLRFSRNFGYQRSILTGYLNAAGDAVIQLDCDLQDPPAMILEFLSRWEAGYQVVYGVRRRRQEGFVITSLRKVIYRTINLLSEHPLPLDAGDFRLVDRRIVEELRQMHDATPYLRGMIATLGFHQLGIEYDRDTRQYGQSKFSFRELVRFALDGIVGHSLVPLRLATYFSQAIFLFACLVTALYAIGRFTVGNAWPAGFTTLAVLVLVSTSVNALLLGIQGEYIGRIYRQVKRQPLSIVEERLNGDQAMPGDTAPPDSRSPGQHPGRQRAA
jgi:polyisoprenyl-phosphate glycosyltransferase